MKKAKNILEIALIVIVLCVMVAALPTVVNSMSAEPANATVSEDPDAPKVVLIDKDSVEEGMTFPAQYELVFQELEESSGVKLTDAEKMVIMMKIATK